MRTAIVVLTCIAVLLPPALTFGADSHPQLRPIPNQPPDHLPSQRDELWSDDLESGAPGWTHGDFTADIPVAFHVSSHMAYDDPEHQDDYSWWCGELNPSFAGGDGYGNSWDQRLELPPVHVGVVATEQTSWGTIKAMYRESPAPGREDTTARSPAPVLTFKYRHDSEANYDFTWVEVESLGTWVPLNAGYDGSSGGWQDLGAGGFSLAGYGDPVKVRFRFTSDAGFSDEDGLYMSDGGAFHVDDIRVYDAVTSEVFYWEDCEGGSGLSTPSRRPPSGDYWRLIESSCQASSGSHVWSIAWPDTAHVPPNLDNWLMTPVIDVSPGWATRVYAQMQMFLSNSWNASWEEEISVDDGATWTRLGWWYGHQCEFGSGPYGPCEHFPSEWVVPSSAASRVAFRWTVRTGPLGAETAPGCFYSSAGITVDDVMVWGTSPSGREDATHWNTIRALY